MVFHITHVGMAFHHLPFMAKIDGYLWLYHINKSMVFMLEGFTPHHPSAPVMFEASVGPAE